MPQPETHRFSTPLEITPEQVRELAILCRTLAHDAAQFIASHRPPRESVADTKSTPTDVVTQMDRDIEAQLRGRIVQLRPDDGLLGEEGSSKASTSGFTWVVDPIDGTVNYLYGLPGYSVSVAVVWGAPDPATWVQVAGAVVRVSDMATWWAGRGIGAFRGETVLAINNPVSLGACLTGTGFGYDARLRALQARVLLEVLPAVRDIRRVGSAAVDLCSLAEGSLDLYFERGLSPWDMAAGTLIAREAGALTIDHEGAPPSKTMTVAGPSGLVLELAEILRKTGAAADINDVR
ncbi:inositol monophosphatase family protein [Timonella senegalensis]|uniref:inositol monophosphatase family protein n=1 Tax=Timonella senegalensis TaxID=1465825 RepID=UPI0028AF6506|nr:inositol monophosphatase family protein [Timonella senegalensis]